MTKKRTIPTWNHQIIAIMAANIYAIRTSANPKRQRLETLRREAVKEAVALFKHVVEANESE